jgi:signal transduction histidine kinase
MPALKPLACGLVGLLMVALAPAELAASPAILAALAVGSLVLALVPVRLPGQPLTISLLPLTVLPAWLLCGAWPAAVLAVLASALSVALRRQTRLPLAWLIPSALAGAGLGTALGSALGALAGDGLLSVAARSAGFAFGFWGGQLAVEWLSPWREDARQSWLLSFLTSLVLLPPGLFLAQIGQGGDPLAFSISLGLAVGALVLVRVSTNSETRTVELEEQAATSADAQQHLELIVDYAPEAIFGIDRDGTVGWLNRTAAEWLGERASAVVGRPAAEGFSVQSTAGGALDHARLLLRAAEEGRPLHEEGLIESAPGAPERVVVSYSAVGDPESDELGLVLLRDASVMTESLREQEELAVHLSHELRAPLTTILGYAQLMSSMPNNNPNTQTEFAKRISESGDYMLRLVNNLLDLGRLSRTGDDLAAAEVDAAELTRDVVEAHHPQASEMNQELTYAGPVRGVTIATADLALRQILTNLVANAVKYTPPGGKIRVSLVEAPDELTWHVADTGIGLSLDEQSKLFTKFFRSARPEARLIKGTGLGLALTKALVDRLEGTISVESEVDKGSTFTLRLPRG